MLIDEFNLRQNNLYRFYLTWFTLSLQLFNKQNKCVQTFLLAGIEPQLQTNRANNRSSITAFTINFGLNNKELFLKFFLYRAAAGSADREFSQDLGRDIAVPDVTNDKRLEASNYPTSLVVFIVIDWIIEDGSRPALGHSDLEEGSSWLWN